MIYIQKFSISASISDVGSNEYFTGKISFPDGDSEYFRAPLGYWGVEEYAGSWNREISSIVNGASKGVLLTGVYDELSANFYKGWTIYNQHDGYLYFRDCIYFVNQIPRGWSLDRPGSLAGPRQEFTEDGFRISEWKIKASDLDLKNSVRVVTEPLAS